MSKEHRAFAFAVEISRTYIRRDFRLHIHRHTRLKTQFPKARLAWVQPPGESCLDTAYSFGIGEMRPRRHQHFRTFQNRTHRYKKTVLVFKIFIVGTRNQFIEIAIGKAGYPFSPKCSDRIGIKTGMLSPKRIRFQIEGQGLHKFESIQKFLLTPHKTRDRS